jgi:hypothetical protein
LEKVKMMSLLIAAITTLINSSTNSGIVAEGMKTALIRPILKEGNYIY